MRPRIDRLDGGSVDLDVDVDRVPAGGYRFDAGVTGLADRTRPSGELPRGTRS